ncbi:MAG: HPr family phosphocarrier protein [Clostridiales bacterium]|nr:HPr family phosphocarrier protein [Clostridiales bacterium]
MKKFDYVITDKEGIHARPAGLLVQEVKKYPCTVTLENKGKSVDAKRLIAVMSLAAKCGETLTVICNGDGEDQAAEALQAFLASTL